MFVIDTIHIVVCFLRCLLLTLFILLLFSQMFIIDTIHIVVVFSDVIIHTNCCLFSQMLLFTLHIITCLLFFLYCNW